MHFKMAQDVRSYFSAIMNQGGSHGSEDKSKFIMFDAYYCCALIGMGCCQIEDLDDSNMHDIIQGYPGPYRESKALIAGLLVASEAKREGIEIQSSAFEEVMLKYLTSEDDTLLTEYGIKTLNKYSLRGARLLQELMPDKPTSREEFLLHFNLAMSMHCK